MSAVDKTRKKEPGVAKVSRKEKMVAVAEALLREWGIGGVTTRAIAEGVPCSEGAIYVHFKDRIALLLAVLQLALPEMLKPLHALAEKAGKGTPEQNLITALSGLQRFHDRVAPMLCSLLTEHELLQRFRQSLEGAGKGPHRGIATLAQYIEKEQSLGRIDGRVDAKTAASVLMASSFFQVFTAQLLGTPVRMEAKQLVAFAIRGSNAPGFEI